MFKQLLASVSTLVVLVSSVGSAQAQQKTTTPITKAEVERIMRHAYNTNVEARLCMDNYAKGYNEIALGFCYSWSYQALDTKEIAVARAATAECAKAIRLGIHHERI